MNTPICDFVRSYAHSNALRLHMPGHKGKNLLGTENLDITEISGADSLYEASGIIHQSEENASALFGCRTLYSTEGSSLCIRSMLYLALLHGRQSGRKPLVAAARNAHKTFLSAAALLDLDVMWLQAAQPESYLACPLSAEDVDCALSNAPEKPFAVYLTSPDYLGNTADISGISAVCRRHGVLLLVDNAHGAYLKFLPESRHPMDLGADLCCDSAHKTLPVLTGGAYLHIADDAPNIMHQQAKNALALFGSTSPSYLILQSLDMANLYLSSGYREKLAAFCRESEACIQRLRAHGYSLAGNEPMKITICTKPYGYTGVRFSDMLMERNIVSEFADPDFCVLMLTPEIGPEGLCRLEDALLSIPPKKAITEAPPAFQSTQRAMSVRSAIFSPAEILPVHTCGGRILAAASVGCPPAVPIVVCGEYIDEHALRCFDYYGIEYLSVVKED